MIPRHISRRINCRLYFALLGLCEQLAKKIHLEHALSARAGNATAGGFVKQLVLYDLAKNLVQSVFLAAQLACIIGAIDTAFAAKIAAFEIVFANLDAFAAARAFIPIKQ